MATTCGILIFDSVIYVLFAWYIEAIWPGRYGHAQKWYFPITVEYWVKFAQGWSLSITNSWDTRKMLQDNRNKLHSVSNPAYVNNENIEMSETANRSNREVGIECIHLHKVFGRDLNHALKGINVQFFKNELSTLLGANGAGRRRIFLRIRML